MTPLDAVAAAIRERLLAGRPAPLPGLGTLVRQHVAARVEERADGSRVLLPPGETIGLAPSGAGQESLASAFGRFRALDGGAASAYADAMDQLEARLAVTGEVRLPGVGLLRRTSGGVILGVEADLLAAVNRTYEGLTPVGTAPAASGRRTPTPAGGSGPLAADGEAGEGPTSGAGTASAAAADGGGPPDDGPVRDLSSEPHGAFQPPAESDLEMGDPTLPPVVETTPVPPDADGPGDAPGPTAPDASTPPLAAPLAAEAHEEPDPAVSPADAVFEGAALGAPDEPEAADEPEAPDELGSLAAGPDTAAGESGPRAGAAGPARDLAPTDVSFVDDDTLDADLDDVLAVPFGASAGPAVDLSDVLPPTPPDRAPPPDTPASAPSAAADDDWSGTTWTSPSADGPPRFEDESDEIEEADYEVVDATPDDPEAASGSGPVVERVGRDAPPEPDGPWTPAAFPADPEPTGPEPLAGAAAPPPVAPVAPPPAVEEPLAAGPPDETAVVSAPTAARSAPPWWVVPLALLVLALLALALLWPRLRPDRTPAPAPGPRAAPAVPLGDPAIDDAPVEDPNPDAREVGAPEPDVPGSPPALVAPTSAPTEAAPGPRVTTSGGGVARPAALRNRVPAAGVAILPPRVADLAADDVRSLSGRAPVAAEGWTLVVLSTPSRDDAQALAARYRSAGYRTAVFALDGGRRATYRLAVGQFATRADAFRLRDRLPPQAPADTWALDLRTL